MLGSVLLLSGCFGPQPHPRSDNPTAHVKPGDDYSPGKDYDKAVPVRDRTKQDSNYPGHPAGSPGASQIARGPSPSEALQTQVQQLNQTVQGLTQSDQNNRSANAAMNQQLALLERNINALRGELEVVRHNNQTLRDQLAELQQISTMPASTPSGSSYTSGSRASTSGTPFNAPEPAYVPPGSAQSAAMDNSVALRTSTQAPPQQQQAAMPAYGQPMGTPPAASPTLERPSDPAIAYDRAFQYLKNGQFEQAHVGFSKFLEWFPSDTRADNAQYWIGEVFYVQRQFPKALTAFNEVLVRFPQSDKYAASLLKIGFSFYELGDYRNARASLERLISDYPDNAAVSMAKQRLELVSRMEQGGSAPR
ncbi:MAG: tol-pal system protein YbgF [Magnetococcales bacterium]|nr:tol-pal system protein YbgF [Magnetococcales bacterium]